MVEGPKVDEVTPQEAVDRHEQGAVLLDVREDDEWAAGHAPINRAGPTEVDLSPPEPVDPVEIRRRIHAGEWVVDLRSRTAFARGHLAGTVNLEVGDSFATFADLADARYDADMVVLDVRRDDEWAEGRIDGAVHIPLHDLEARLDTIPDGEVWVHCASGYRASIAASLLDRAGRTVVAIDDEWAAAKHDALGVGIGG